ncbi:MAG: glycosyltransferase family 39 protein [Actinomycetota bacterium]
MHRAALVAILLLALCLRIGFALTPADPQAPDSRGYARIAQSLYQDGRFEQRGNFVAGETQESSNYSPGLPIFVAGLYELSGGVHPEFARIVLAIIGTVGVFLAYLLGRRFGGPIAGLIAALLMATYPAMLEFQSMIMTEPLATTLLAGALLACFRASDRGGTLAWALPGLLLGLMAMVRPEYLMFGALLPLLALWRSRRATGPRPALVAAVAAALAFAIPILPWTIRNAIVLDRLVPISTGSGKVLYIGTYLPTGGDGTELRQELLERDPAMRRRLVNELQPARPAAADPWPLFSQLEPAEGLDPQVRLSQRLRGERVVELEQVLDQVAARRYPGTPTDVALGRMGRHNLSSNFGDDPFGMGEMLARKAYEAWITGPRATMLETPWRIWHALIVAFALLGMIVVAQRRRWEAVPFALLALAATALSALLIASPRRVIVILPVLAALAGTGVVWLAERLRAMRAAP